MDFYITAKLATMWWKKPETMLDIHKRRKRCTTRRIYLPQLSSLPSPIRPTSISSNRGRLHATLRRGWLQGDGNYRGQWMGYKKNRSDARAEERESCQQHSFSYWVLMGLHIIRDKEGNRPRRTNVTPFHFV